MSQSSPEHEAPDAGSTTAKTAGDAEKTASPDNAPSHSRNRANGSPDATHWPTAGGRRIVFLLDANSAIERRYLTRWIERTRPEEIAKADYRVLHVLSSRRKGALRDLNPRLEEALATVTRETDR